MRRRWPERVPGRAIVGSAESRSIHSGGARGRKGDALARSSREPEVAVKNFPVDVWWPVYEARTAHFAVFGVSGVVHQRVYRGLGHGGMSSQRCWTRGRRGEGGEDAVRAGGERAMRSAPSVEGAPRGERRAEGAKWQWWWQWVADGEGICWREWLASRITTGRVIRGGFPSRWGWPRSDDGMGYGMTAREARGPTRWMGGLVG